MSLFSPRSQICLLHIVCSAVLVLSTRDSKINSSLEGITNNRYWLLPPMPGIMLDNLNSLTLLLTTL